MFWSHGFACFHKVNRVCLTFRLVHIAEDYRKDRESRLDTHSQHMYTTTEARQMLLCTYVVLAGNSILIYDHMVTLLEEIDFIWRRPKALSATLFLLNRYVALFGFISSSVMDLLLVSDEGCSKYTLCRQLYIFFQGIIICIIMAIRTYALYDCSKRLLTCMTIIIIALAGVACAVTFARISGDAAIFPGVGCYETYTAEIAARIGLAWVALFVFDLLIFVLTLCKFCKTRGLLRLSLVTRGNIIDIIFHDGAMYFGAMALINIPNIWTYYSGSVATRGSLCNFTTCISATLMSRLMLNLHKTADTDIFSTPSRDDDRSLVVLTTRVGVQSAISSHHW
ncbi:hypothetical protein DEU56DRAFT_780586 [Suillus clintonianus]|uniref:uncharacterized protein n=1 Tax=Suillus clintonianus TaxID=1904413 RepID=UPI001B85D769|nr:uncharacterized protein DEU56DRAFT_780586 [Suillus clintonianus]KAG2150537.1 hypothetical protein DEU56DRAFT_780586 [Suillus clintonianus]